MSQPNNNNNNDDDDKKYKKIFVGGLAWKVTSDGMRSFFQENFGEVLEANVVSHTLPDGSLKSKGYGFVTFRDAESATKACQPPHPEIEGRQTNINLAYINAKNNHSNQTGLVQQAGPSHQYQYGQMASHQYQNGPFNQAWHPYQNGWFSQVGTWHQYPQFNTKPHFPQVYWGSSYHGAYRHGHDVQHYYSCSSTMNWHQTNSVRPPSMPQPPTGPRFEELPNTNQEAVSTPDGVRNDNNEEVDTETGIGVDQQKGKDQEEEISGQDNGIKQDAKDEEGKINGQNNGIKQDVKDQEGEINGQDNGIKQDVKDQEEKIVSGEDDDTTQGAGVTGQPCTVALPIETVCEEKSESTPQENGLDHEEKTQDMEAGVITKKETDKNA